MNDLKGERGPAWYDVAAALRDLEKTWGVYAKFWISVDVSKAAPPKGLTIVMEMVKADRTAWQRAIPGFVSAWPHVDHKTMPGLMMKIAYLANERMLERQQEEKSVAQPALPF